MRSQPRNRPGWILSLLALGTLISAGCDSEPPPQEEQGREIIEDDFDSDSEPADSEGETEDGLDRGQDDAFEARISPQGDAVFRFQGPHSEETPGVSQCPPGEVVTGFDCTGGYCDNVNIECFEYGGSVASSGSWSAWFEHNGKVLHTCPPGTKMTGIDCSGSYCDNVRIECTSAPGLDTDNCQWLPSSGWYSEEHPTPFFAPMNRAFQGVWCNGTHCDNKRFRICDI